MHETQVRSLVGKIPWRRAWQPSPVFLPGESHGWRSLAGTVHGVTGSQTWLRHSTTWHMVCLLCSWHSHRVVAFFSNMDSKSDHYLRIIAFVCRGRGPFLPSSRCPARDSAAQLPIQSCVTRWLHFLQWNVSGWSMYSFHSASQTGNHLTWTPSFPTSHRKLHGACTCHNCASQWSDNYCN